MISHRLCAMCDKKFNIRSRHFDPQLYLLFFAPDFLLEQSFR